MGVDESREQRCRAQVDVLRARRQIRCVGVAYRDDPVPCTTTATWVRGLAASPSIIAAAVITVVGSVAAASAPPRNGKQIHSAVISAARQLDAMPGEVLPIIFLSPRCRGSSDAHALSSWRWPRIRGSVSEFDGWTRAQTGTISGLRTRLRYDHCKSFRAGGKRIALSYQNGQFGAISGVCNHAGGPLGEGRLDGEFVVCPWHNWKFHCRDWTRRAGVRGGERPELRAEDRSRAALGRSRTATRRTPSAAPAARLSPARSRARPGRCASLGISTTVDGASPIRATRPRRRCSRGAASRRRESAVETQMHAAQRS